MVIALIKESGTSAGLEMTFNFYIFVRMGNTL